MKVGIFCENYDPAVGGGHTFEGELLQSIASFGSGSGHEFVVYSRSKEPLLEIASAPHVQFISLYHSFGKRSYAKIREIGLAIFRKLRRPKSPFRIEHWFENLVLNSIWTNGIEITWSLGLGCITKEVPYIATVYDLQHRLQPYFPEVSTDGRWGHRELDLFGQVLQRAAFVITGTEAGKAEIERFYQVPGERIRILPHPTPKFALDAPPCTSEQVLEKYDLPKNYLFYPAQFWPHKNHVGLLLAVRWLRDTYGLIFPVVFVGSDKGNLRYIRQFTDRLGLSKQVYFLGFVPRADLVSLYRNAFALAYVTFFGPENLPPLEAFALGCPVIASEVSGAEEQLGNAALLVDPKDEKRIALAIKSLYDNPVLRQTLIQRGLARATQWTGRNYAKGVFGIFEEFESIRRCWSSSERYRERTA